MIETPIERITEYHAHVYYNAETKSAAADLRAAIEERFGGLRMGRWHDRPVGPHPCWSYQIAFDPDRFGSLVPWLALNRGSLVIFVHPTTGDAIADHTRHALWLGRQVELNLDALSG